MGTERGMGAERIRHGRQGLAEMGSQHVFVGDIVGDFAQAIHIVGKGNQTGRDLILGQNPKGMADHAGAGHFAKRADMGQARGAITGFKQDLFLTGPFDTGQQFAGFLKGPSGAFKSRYMQSRGRNIGHGLEQSWLSGKKRA